MVEIYKNYMIVYIDILGFAKKIENTLDNPSETLKIANILHKARSRLLNLNKGAITGPEMKGRMFSDTIVLTYPNPDLLAVNDLIAAAAIIQFEMIKGGLFVRGAAVIGKHYMKKGIDLGPAIIRARDMERLASWPRIVVDPSVMQQAKPVSDKRYKRCAKDLLPMLAVSLNHIARDERISPMPAISGPNEWDRRARVELERLFNKTSSDGLKYVDYLDIIFPIWVTEKWSSEYKKETIADDIAKDLFSTHREAILRAITSKGSEIGTEILTKFHCLATYHNIAIDALCRKISPRSGSARPESDKLLARFYQQLSLFLAVYLSEIPPSQRIELLKTKFDIDNLSKWRHELRSYKIDLPKTFPALYKGNR